MLLRAWQHPVTRSGRLGAYARYLAWRLSASMTPGPALIPFVNHTFLLAEPVTREARELCLLILRDLEAMAFVAHFLRNDEYFVDVGAGIGSFTVLAAAAATACVTAFEPHAERAALLRRNAALNGLGARVDARELVLAEVSGAAESFWSGDRHRPSPMRRRLSDIAAPSAVRLDEARLAGCPILARIDVGGDELSVLRGAHATLANPGLCALIIGSCHLSAWDPVRQSLVQAVLERHGFAPIDYDPFLRRVLRPENSRDSRIFLRVQKAGHVIRRLAQAPGVRVNKNLCL